MKPHSPKQVTKYLEETYAAKGRFTYLEQLGKGQYLFYDEERGVQFEVKSIVYGWGQSGLFPLPHRSIYSHLNSEIVAAMEPQALALAEQYKLRLKNGTDIYITDYDRLEDAVALFIALGELYNFETTKTGLGLEAHFFYHPNAIGNELQTERVRLDDVYFIYLKEGGTYYNNETALLNHLQQRWADTARYNDKLPEIPGNREQYYMVQDEDEE